MECVPLERAAVTGGVKRAVWASRAPERVRVSSSAVAAKLAGRRASAGSISVLG